MGSAINSEAQRDMIYSPEQAAIRFLHFHRPRGLHSDARRFDCLHCLQQRVKDSLQKLECLCRDTVSVTAKTCRQMKREVAEHLMMLVR